MKNLADVEIASLKYLTIEWEETWFEGRVECMTLLLSLLARQPALTELTMKHNLLSATQKQQIRDVVGQTAPSCDIIRL